MAVSAVRQPWSPNAKSSMNLEMQIEEGDNVARDLSVTFRDEAGNESAACAVDSITVDTAPLRCTGSSCIQIVARHSSPRVVR